MLNLRPARGAGNTAFNERSERQSRAPGARQQADVRAGDVADVAVDENVADDDRAPCGRAEVKCSAHIIRGQAAPAEPAGR